MRGIWGVLQAAAALELALEKALASRSMVDKMAQQVEMMHAPEERVRAVLLVELLHDDPLEVPLVVGEPSEPVVQRVQHCLRETERPANRLRTFVGKAPPCR